MLNKLLNRREPPKEAPPLEGGIATLFKACGNATLFSKDAIAAIDGVRAKLKILVYEHPPETMTSENMIHTRNSLESMITLLDKLCERNDEGLPNNNLNLFISQPAQAFYSSLSDTLDINDDLAAKAGEIVWQALNENNLSNEIFPGKMNFIVKGVYNGYTAINGDHIKIAKEYIRAKLDCYRISQENSDNNTLIQSVAHIRYHSKFAIRFAKAEDSREKAITQFSIISSSIHNEKFQLSANAQQGFSAVALGAVLQNFAQCQSEFKQKGIPIAPIGVKLPPAASVEKYNLFKAKVTDFDHKLMRECEKVCGKPPSEGERMTFDELLTNLRNQQPQNSAENHNIALDLLNRYTFIAEAIQAQAIWNANPDCTRILKDCAAELNVLISEYSLDLSAKELPPMERQALSQPDKSPEHSASKQSTENAKEESTHTDSNKKEITPSDDNTENDKTVVQNPHV